MTNLSIQIGEKIESLVNIGDVVKKGYQYDVTDISHNTNEIYVLNNIGLVPTEYTVVSSVIHRSSWEGKRLSDLKNGITNCLSKDEFIPYEWLEEYNELLQSKEKKKRDQYSEAM